MENVREDYQLNVLQTIKNAATYEVTINLTQDYVLEEEGSSRWKREIGCEEISSYSEIIKYLEEQLLEDEYKQFYHDFLDKDILLGQFSGKELNKSMDYQRHYMDKTAWMRCNLYLYTKPESDDVWMYLLVTNMDESQNEEQLLQEMACKDELTKLYNRHYALPIYKEYFSTSRKESAALIMIDMDDFKNVNDNYGHGCGDKVLFTLAEKLQRYFGNDSIICRYGGDEFLVLCKNVTREEILQSLKAYIDERTIVQDGNMWFPVTNSIGFAMFPEQGESYEELFSMADHAMFAAKARGKNTFAQYDPIMQNMAMLKGKAFDRTGLDSRLFDGISQTSKRRYIYLCNMDSMMSHWSKNAVDYFGLPGEYMSDAGTVWANYIHPDDREAYIKDIADVFSGRKDRHSMDYRAKNKEGEYVICTCEGVVLRGKGIEPDLFMGTIENHGIADNVDAITNLYNIYEFYQYIHEQKSKQKNVQVLFIGINQFSEINNRYGFTFGDQVLRSFAQKMSSLMQGYGMVFRMDGVRFACCFTDKEEEEIKIFYNQMQYQARHRIYVDGVRIAVSLSGGVAVLDETGNEFSIQTCGGYALEQSKYEYHGELVFFENDMADSKQKNLELLTELRKCILNDEEGFYLAYQPIICVEGETLIGAEALLRFRKEPFGEVPPGIYIPWLENDPSFFDLGNWILRQSMMECRRIVNVNPDFVLNVNIAYTQLSRVRFREVVQNILQDTGFPPGNLCLELTERCRQLEKNYLRQEIEFFRSLGIKIAVDDFGTGYSSLQLLSILPVDTIKIDRGFVWDIETNLINQAIVNALTNCAADLSVKVCVEGLETREMIDYIKKYPVYSYQGYYFSKPLPVAQFWEKYFSMEES